MERLTILLGAGAATPWKGKLTAELTPEVLNTLDYTTKTTSQPLGLFIQEELAKYFYKKGVENVSKWDLNREINFEIVLNALEILYEYYRNKEISNPIFTMPVSPGLFSVIDNIDKEIRESRFEQHDDESHGKSLFVYNCYNQIIERIKNHISAYSYNFSLNDLINKNFNLFINNLILKYKLRIYTLNYDDILNEIKGIPNFYNGFDLKKGVRQIMVRLFWIEISNVFIIYMVLFI
jgi:hypothetical protein